MLDARSNEFSKLATDVARKTGRDRKTVVKVLRGEPTHPLIEREVWGAVAEIYPRFGFPTAATGAAMRVSVPKRSA